MKALEELELNTVRQYANERSEKPKLPCHHCDKLGHYEKKYRQLREQEEQAADSKTSSGPNNSARTNSNSNSSNNDLKNDKKVTEDLELSTLPQRHMKKRTIPQRDVFLEPMQQTGHFLRRANQEYSKDLNIRRHRAI